MRPCACTTHHAGKRIVLTGGPGAGKTAVLELVRQEFCAHVKILPQTMQPSCCVTAEPSTARRTGRVPTASGTRSARRRNAR